MSRNIINDIITSIRNAYINKKVKVKIVSTNITKNIVKILLQEGFIENIRKHKENKKNFLVSTLQYKNISKEKKRIYKNISRPSLQIYYNYKKISNILVGIGILILYTSKGIMTNKKALLEKIGGKKICYIW